MITLGNLFKLLHYEKKKELEAIVHSFGLGWVFILF